LLYSKYGIPKPGGAILYDPRDSKAGFDQDGQLCSPTPTTNPPNSTCPIRVDFSWVSKCASCNPGLVEITVKFKTYRSWAPPSQRIRTTPYDFTLIKSVYPKTEGPNW
jgi:hypothetical protein